MTTIHEMICVFADAIGIDPSSLVEVNFDLSDVNGLDAAKDVVGKHDLAVGKAFDKGKYRLVHNGKFLKMLYLKLDKDMRPEVVFGEVPDYEPPFDSYFSPGAIYELESEDSWFNYNKSN